ncbi:MAG: hypothetical protein LUG60_01550 [Erysipelotrichaceae bacterium]|nr:hypothetical protein [Erysipelotrichaceae bacterium]
MGEYYSWINIDKKEYIQPIDFDIGYKAHESMFREDTILYALKELLYDRWKNDHIAFIGDEFSVSDDENNPLLKALYNQMLFYKFNTSVDVFDMILEHYRNVSGLFKDAEEEVRQEIGYYIEDIQNDDISIDLINYYGVDINNPYDGLFELAGRDFKYTINYTKKVCYSFGKTRILTLDNTQRDDIDPLPILMHYGRSTNIGLWLGDIIGVSDEMPEGFILLDEIYLDF